MSHICVNNEYRFQVGVTNRAENIVIRCLSLTEKVLPSVNYLFIYLFIYLQAVTFFALKLCSN
jgi:hypothetical protein